MSKKNLSYKEFVEQLSGDELESLQRFAKNRVIEPFEGHSAIETIQKADRTLSKSLEKVKQFGQKAGNTKIPGIPSGKIRQILKSSQVLDRFGRITQDFSKLTKSKLKEMEEWVRERVFEFIKSGIELSKSIDYEKWVVDKAALTLNKEIHNLHDIRKLSPGERSLLIETLYPHKSNRYKRLIDSFDKTFNIVLGLIVASNIPGTGILVSLINIARTIIRISNAINSISAIHGYKVINFPHLFKVSAALIQTLDDWDNNADHIPLSPDILEKLYSESDEEFEHDLIKLLEAAGSKELYIAIPGVGMLSLGKINLDNYKLDALVLNLVRDYFLAKQVIDSEYGERYSRIIEDFKLIYTSIKEQGILKEIKKRIEDEDRPETRKEKIGKLFKSMWDNNTKFEALSRELNKEVARIFRAIIDLPPEKKELEIQNRLPVTLSQDREADSSR